MMEVISIEWRDEIYHYGVLGMKWGVRKNPQKAYEKASKKLKKLNAKVQKQESNLQKRNAKMQKAQSKAQRAILFRGLKRWNATGQTTRTAKAYSNIQQSKQRAKTWASQMDSIFSGVKIKNVDKETRAIGKKYANMTIDEIMSTNVNINSLLETSDRYRTRFNL